MATPSASAPRQRFEVWVRAGDTTRPADAREERLFYEAMYRDPKWPASLDWPYEIRVRTGDGRRHRASVADEKAFYRKALAAARPTGSPSEPEPTLASLRDELRALVESTKANTRRLAEAEVRLLSKAAAAKRLGIGDATLTYLIKSKQLSTVRVKKRLKIRAGDVERLGVQGFSRPP